MKVAYIRLTAFSPVYNLQTGTFGELITEIDGRRNIKNRLSQRFFCRSCLFQKRTADRLLRFKVSTDIIIIVLTGGTDRKIKQVITILILKTIALRFIPTLIDETDKIMKAQKARGADFESGGLIQKAKSLIPLLRSEERRVGKECRSRWSPYH